MPRLAELRPEVIRLKELHGRLVAAECAFYSASYGDDHQTAYRALQRVEQEAANAHRMLVMTVCRMLKVDLPYLSSEEVDRLLAEKRALTDASELFAQYEAAQDVPPCPCGAPRQTLYETCPRAAAMPNVRHIYQLAPAVA